MFFGRPLSGNVRARAQAIAVAVIGSLALSGSSFGQTTVLDAGADFEAELAACEDQLQRSAEFCDEQSQICAAGAVAGGVIGGLPTGMVGVVVCAAQLTQCIGAAQAEKSACVNAALQKIEATFEE